eukprot:GFYU01000620.1.p1 GENE.GFYU01000620.1~~GFYU01000620.1.p1  ORF type:complete len:230 (-),score=58.92 GFYU01000620.1:238-882(-)
MSRWSPYVDNGGTVMGLAGQDFCILGADTRMSIGYSIHTRHAPKYTKLTDKCVLITSGMQADMATLHKVLKARLTMYEHQHGKPMSTPAIAQLLSNTLYYKRFFPYYTFNLLGGVDENGEGCVFTYDAIGSHERVKFSSQGTGAHLIQAVLDNQIGFKNQQREPVERTLDQSVAIVKDVFTSACERDIFTGDHVDICVIANGKVSIEKFDLKYD